MTQRKGFIRKGGTINAGAAGTISVGKVSPLNHEIGYESMEGGVSIALGSGAGEEGEEIAGGAGTGLGIEEEVEGLGGGVSYLEG